MSLAQMRAQNAPLRDLIESFFRANYDLSKNTERWYRQNFGDYLAFVERATGREPRLSDVSKPMADAFLKERSSKPTKKYPKGSAFAARAAATSVKRLANYLAEDGILADNFGASVLRHVKRGKVDDDVRQPLSEQGRDRAIGAATMISPVARAICVFGHASGLRLNELREARVGDLDLARGEFNVRPETSKFGKGRTVFIHPEVIREMDRYLRDRAVARVPDAALFPSRLGLAFTIDGLPKLFERVRRASGLSSFSAHILRHSWATSFMRVPGANLLDLKRQGGWDRWEMVERYSHAVPVLDRRALPNPLQKTAFSQQPATRVSSLRRIS